MPGSDVIATEVIIGGASGVAIAASDSAPSPSEFTPRTSTVYSVPLVSPAIVNVPPVFDTFSVLSVQAPYEPVVLVRYWYFVMSDVPWSEKTTVASMDWFFAASVRVGLSGGRIRVTVVADTAAMPLPARSVTASALSATVRLGMAAFMDNVTLLPLITCPNRVTVVVPDITVILVVSALPMFSLKTRMIFVPSSEVLGALSPVVTSVGFTVSGPSSEICMTLADPTHVPPSPESDTICRLWRVLWINQPVAPPLSSLSLVVVETSPPVPSMMR